MAAVPVVASSLLLVEVVDDELVDELEDDVLAMGAVKTNIIILWKIALRVGWRL